jgi:hypothetical protein
MTAPPEARESLVATARALRAQPRSVVERPHPGRFWIDANGQAISPARARFQMALHYFFYGVGGVFLVGMGTMAGGVLGGVLGAGAAAAMIATHDRPWVFRARLYRLLGAERHDDAEALCRRLLARRRASPLMRSLGHRGLAYLRLRVGDFAGALEEYRSAVELRESWPADFGPFERATLVYGEVLALVNLGRVAEARTRLATVPMPRRDYLRIQHWIADLFVQLGEGRVSIPEEELWQRARTGLAVLASGALVPLCGWAFEQLGDREMAEHLREVALDRGARGLERAAPALHRWLHP